jgi:hypothetical protein
MRPEDLPLEDRLKVAAAASRFFECLAAQQRQDAAIISSLVRTLRNPRGVARVEVEQFVELVCGIVTGFNVLAGHNVHRAAPAGAQTAWALTDASRL